MARTGINQGKLEQRFGIAGDAANRCPMATEPVTRGGSLGVKVGKATGPKY
jgi:hypothetical protein